jgi:hypothetical protein
MRTLLVLACVLCAPAKAASITYTVTFTNFDPVPAIPQYQELFGMTLNEVDVTVTGSTSWSATVDPGLSSGTYEPDAQMGLSASGGIPLGSSAHNFAFAFTSPQTSLTLTNSLSFTDQFTSGLTPFIGSGSYYPIGTQSHKFLSTEPLLQSQTNTGVFALFEYDVTYSFTAPEPPASVLLATGLVFLGVLGRDRFPISPPPFAEVAPTSASMTLAS